MNAVGGVSNQSSGGNGGSDVAAFSAVAAARPLTVNGNTIDTGRYQINGSNLYTRPPDGGTADDGMVRVPDKVTNTFVDVFGDPHVYTSDGDRAEFQKDALETNLADGTQLQFKPTAVTSDGVSHIAALAVSRSGQTVVETGLYSADGSAKVSIGAVQQGGPATTEGFNDANATVLSSAPGGGLNILVNQAGVQLSSKTSQTMLDGMGGAANAPGSVSPQLGARQRLRPRLRLDGVERRHAARQCVRCYAGQRDHRGHRPQQWHARAGSGDTITGNTVIAAHDTPISAAGMDVSGNIAAGSADGVAAALGWASVSGLVDRSQIAPGYQPGTGNGANNSAGNRR